MSLPYPTSYSILFLSIFYLLSYEVESISYRNVPVLTPLSGGLNDVIPLPESPTAYSLASLEKTLGYIVSYMPNVPTVMYHPTFDTFGSIRLGFESRPITTFSFKVTEIRSALEKSTTPVRDTSFSVLEVRLWGPTDLSLATYVGINIGAAEFTNSSGLSRQKLGFAVNLLHWYPINIVSDDESFAILWSLTNELLFGPNATLGFLEVITHVREDKRIPASCGYIPLFDEDQPGASEEPCVIAATRVDNETFICESRGGKDYTKVVVPPHSVECGCPQVYCYDKAPECIRNSRVPHCRYQDPGPGSHTSGSMRTNKVVKPRKGVSRK